MNDWRELPWITSIGKDGRGTDIPASIRATCDFVEASPDRIGGSYRVIEDTETSIVHLLTRDPQHRFPEIEEFSISCYRRGCTEMMNVDVWTSDGDDTHQLCMVCHAELASGIERDPAALLSLLLRMFRAALSGRITNRDPSLRMRPMDGYRIARDLEVDLSKTFEAISYFRSPLMPAMLAVNSPDGTRERRNERRRRPNLAILDVSTGSSTIARLHPAHAVMQADDPPDAIQMLRILSELDRTRA